MLSAGHASSRLFHPLRRDAHLRRHRRADRTSASLSRGRTRQRNESHAAGNPMSSRHRHGRQTPRLRRQRRIEDQGLAIENGGRGKIVKGFCDGVSNESHEFANQTIANDGESHGFPSFVSMPLFFTRPAHFYCLFLLIAVNNPPKNRAAITIAAKLSAFALSSCAEYFFVGVGV